MSKRYAISLETYGDFDMPMNAGILTAPEGMSKTEVGRIAQEISDSQENTRDTTESLRLFKKYGFTTYTVVDCKIGGNL